MKDSSKDSERTRQPPEVHTDGASRALSDALRKTFEDLLQEPVPERFNELIARIREAEAKRNAGCDKDES